MLLFPAPSEAALAFVAAGDMVGFCDAWRTEAVLTKGDLKVVPNLRACADYFRALDAGMPPLSVAVCRDERGPNYSVRLADGRTDPLLTHLAAEAVGLADQNQVQMEPYSRR